MEELYQACYGKPGNNWELLNTSKNITPTMMTFFERIGNGCTPQNMDSDSLTVKNGEPLCLYEIISDNNIICVLRAKYGEKDNFGRPKMFAHGFLFPAEGVLDDPKNILGISDDNFKYDSESTKEIPGELIYDSVSSVEDMLGSTGFDKAKWITLMSCVYTVMNSPSDMPLYICSDYELPEIKKIIYLIYSALPVELRYHLSFSNSNSLKYSKFRRIMFVEKPNSGDFYFDCASGKTNVDFSDIKQYTDKYPFLVEFEKNDIKSFETVCEKVSDVAKKLQYPYNAESEQLILAYTLLKNPTEVDSLSDKDLTRCLLELLVKSPLQNLFVDDYITNVLTVYEKRNLIPNETIMNRIEQRKDHTPSVGFVDISRKIRMKVLLNDSDEKIINFLAGEYSKSKTQFEEWKSSILNISGGEKAIIGFYSKKIKTFDTTESLLKFYEEIKSFSSGSEISKTLAEQVFIIAGRKLAVLSIKNGDSQAVLSEFMGTINKMNLHLPQEDVKSFITRLCENFWNHFSYSEFEFTKNVFSNCLCMKYSNTVGFQNIKQLSELFEIFSNKRPNYGQVEDYIDAFTYNNRFTPRELNEIVPKMQDFIVRNMHSDTAAHFMFWTKLAMIGEPELSGNDNPVIKMVRWRLPVICDTDYFKSSLTASIRMQAQSKAIFEWLVGVDGKGGALRKTENPELQKLLKIEAKILNDFAKEKAARNKADEKEQRKNEKSVNHTNEKKGLFGKFKK